MPQLQNLPRVLICFHAANVTEQPRGALIDKLCRNIALTDGRIGSRLLVNLHHVPVPERLGLVHFLLPLEAAGPLEPRKLLPLRQITVNLAREVCDGRADRGGLLVMMEPGK